MILQSASTGDVPDFVLSDEFLYPERTSYLVERVANLAAVALLAVGGVTANTAQPALPVVRDLAGETAASGSSFGTGVYPPSTATAGAELSDLARQVRRIHARSGLTWEQLARLFGVSRRAVHNWANGGRMTARHAEELTWLVRVIDTLPGTDSNARRAQLFSPGSDGTSMYERLRLQMSTRSTVITDTPLAPDQLLGALHDD